MSEHCDATEASCACNLPSGHDGAHECECGGAWCREGGEFQIVAFPGIGRIGTLELIGQMLESNS